ncbi:TetR/AcrR family transcriptional regulator [Deinococcus cellulosilyticus]|uniref:HTH tetR-type domain-containing protein n=1 Tax=Deinococcus cellulosilyticus (strain DSM 18568 / NBRC 106333 / KACC 11606 / 5516J-15) TaxID=1223518 RepID=A0A511N9F2_DEIC1|nr:TetR/AcrR family transcriptional regulator [Deinococcus cellulosilyticus]GEM49118.1 hypothetical protein DC3_47530 [Deinococcus cellulosilyticus NBRC 106333 = KACC 11606]
MTDTDLKSKILDAALECMIELGIAGVTTKAIAARAGVNEVTLFRRFGNKTNLLRSVLSREAEMVATQGFHYTGNLREDLIGITRAYLDLTARHPGLIPMMLSELPRHPELMEVFEGPKSLIFTAGQIIVRYQMEGKLKPEFPFQTLATLLGPIIVMRLGQRLLPQDLPPHEIQAEQLVDFHLHGRSRPSGEQGL